MRYSIISYPSRGRCMDWQGVRQAAVSSMEYSAHNNSSSSRLRFITLTLYAMFASEYPTSMLILLLV